MAAAEEGSIQPAIWLGWVKTLPEELVHARPVLNVWYAYALLVEVRWKPRRPD